MWIDVFRTGNFTPTDGAVRYFSEADLDRIAQQYDPRTHEAPVTVGEVKAGSPAYGWVKSLKREGSVLYAELKDARAEFLEMVKRKVFPKKSVTFYPSGELRSIGFLGADPPDVGLSKLPGLCAFSESDAVYKYEFEECQFKDDRTFSEASNSNTLRIGALVESKMRRNPSLTRAEAFLAVVAQKNDSTFSEASNSDALRIDALVERKMQQNPSWTRAEAFLAVVA